MQTLPTQNEEWGFYGTLLSNRTTKTDSTTAKLYAKASRLIIAAGFTKEQTRSYLDSRLGRHMADAISKQSELAHVVNSWIAKGIVQRTVDEIAKEEA